MKKKSIILSNMKKAFVVLMVAFMSLGLASCSDWLEMPSYTADDTEFVFKDELMAEMYQTAITAFYKHLGH